MRNIFKLLAILILSYSLSACAQAVVSGATAGTAAAMQERGLGGAVTDAGINAKINRLLFEEDVDIFRKVDVTVHERRVLLTGIVPNPQHRVDAVRLAWQVDGVKEVINELRVQDKSNIKDYAKDAWITTQLRTKLTFDAKVQAINYSIETVNGVIYLMGVAQDGTELEKVTNHARNIKYVQKVVSYVRLKSDVEQRY